MRWEDPAAKLFQDGSKVVLPMRTRLGVAIQGFDEFAIWLPTMLLLAGRRLKVRLYLYMNNATLL